MSAVARPRRALVVAYDFPPHGAIGTMRTLRVVRELDARGWAVTVLTSHPSAFREGTPVEEALLSRVPASVRVIRAAAIRPWEGLQAAIRRRHQPIVSSSADERGDGGARREPPPRLASRRGAMAGIARAKDVIDAALAIPDRESGWLLPALGKGLLAHLRAETPDVIYSSAPPWTGQLVAAGLKLALRRPWVADFRDPWQRAPWREVYPFVVRAAGRLEQFVVRRADRVVFVASANRDEFAAHYGPAVAAKFVDIANGCDTSEFDALRGVVEPSSDPFVLLHAGSLYAGRTPMPLLNALAAAIHAGRIDPRRFRFTLLGTNGLRNLDLHSTCHRLGLADVVHLVPRVPRNESLRAMLGASCLLLLQPGHAVSVPGKLYEYLAAGRRIIAIAEEGEIARIVRSSGLGVSLTGEDESAIADALVDAYRRGAERLPLPPREMFDGSISAARIVALLDRVASGVPASGQMPALSAESYE